MTIRARILPRLPVRAIAGPGVDASISQGALNIGLDYRTLIETPIPDYSDYLVAAQDPASGSFISLPLTTLGPSVWNTASRATLKLLSPTLVTAVFLKESGREGIFQWKSGNYSAQVTVDTAEGIFIPSSLVAVTSGAWVRQFSGDVDAKWFGAVFDGTTTDTAAMQAALNCMAVAPSNILWLPPATAIIDAYLNIPSNIIVAGTRRRTWLKAKAGSTADPLLTMVMSRTNVTFDGVGFDGNLANVTGFPTLTFNNVSSFVRYVRCEFKDSRGIASPWGAAVDSGCEDCNFDNIGTVYLTSGVLTDRKQALAFFNVGTRNYAIGNRFNKIGLDCISCAGGEIQFKIIGNRCRENYAGAIYISNAQSFICTENIVELSEGNAIDTNVALYGTIANNVCFNNGAAGILISGGQRISVVGNICYNNNTTNINHRGGITINIETGEAVTDLTIDDNVCFDTREGTSSVTQTYGIHLAVMDGTKGRIKIGASNHLRGYDSGGVFAPANMIGPHAESFAATEHQQVFTLANGATKILARTGSRGTATVHNLSSGAVGEFALRSGSAVIEMFDSGTAFEVTDTGTTTAVYRDAGTGHVFIRNRTGGNQSYSVFTTSMNETMV